MIVPRIAPLRRWWLRRRFPVELALIAGEHETVNRHRSILHFSVNRAATQYVKSILFRCGAENGLTPVQFHAYSFVSDFPYLDQLGQDESTQFRHLFKPEGYVYSDLGGLVGGIELERFGVVLAIRDPRDVLTSEYFSSAYSHTRPWNVDKIDEFDRQRREAIEYGIDRYVLSQSVRVRDIYKRYLDRLVGQGHVHVARYEEMILDFTQWLESILQFCSLEISGDLRSELISERLKSTAKDDPSSHVRQVRPGDYRRKLQLETIRELDVILADVLEGFGYGID